MDAEEEGVYFGKCAELCGPSHSLMDFKVVAVSEDDYETWVTDMQDFDSEEVELDAVATEGKESKSCMSVTHVSRSEEHTSELQSRGQLVCRLLLDIKKTLG